MNTVTEVLQDEFSVCAKTDEKIACPFCGHNAFSIKSNNQIGKCWHPSCQERIIPKRYDNEWKYSISQALEQFYQKCHENLLDYAGEEGRTPYNYIVHERGIHPQVVEDAMLGVVPQGVSVSPLLDPIIKRCQEWVGSLKADREVGRPSSDEILRLMPAEPVLKKLLSFSIHIEETVIDVLAEMLAEGGVRQVERPTRRASKVTKLGEPATEIGYYRGYSGHHPYRTFGYDYVKP